MSMPSHTILNQEATKVSHLPKHIDRKIFRESEAKTQRILDLGMRRSSVVSFTLRPSYSWRKSLLYVLYTKLGGSHIRSIRGDEAKRLITAWNHQTDSRPDFSSCEIKFKAAWKWSWPITSTSAENKNAWSPTSTFPFRFLVVDRYRDTSTVTWLQKTSAELLVFGISRDGSRVFLANGLEPAHMV